MALRELNKLMANAEQSRNDQATLAVSRRRKRKTEGSDHVKIQIFCEVKKTSRLLCSTDKQKDINSPWLSRMRG